MISEAVLNKYFYIFILIFSGALYAQNAASQIETKRKFSESDLIIDSDSISKVQFRENYKENYSSDAFVYEAKLAKKNAWDRFVEWLQEQLNRLFNVGNNETTYEIVDITLKVIAALIIIFVIYLIVKSILNKDGQWIFGRNSDKNIIRYEDVEKNLQIVDFEKLIAQTIANGQNRLTIRYYYLWLLKMMSQREIIVWDIEKTNSDYIYEIQNDLLKQEFSYLSYLYNYIWYGEFELDNNMLNKAKTAFEKTIQKLPR